MKERLDSIEENQRLGRAIEPSSHSQWEPISVEDQNLIIIAGSAARFLPKNIVEVTPEKPEKPNWSEGSH